MKKKIAAHVCQKQDGWYYWHYTYEARVGLSQPKRKVATIGPFEHSESAWNDAVKKGFKVDP